jgi:hypothetical protein
LGTSEGVVITGVPCDGKGLLVTKGDDITIRNITFAGARVPEGNGAGIRAEGRKLTIEHSRFIDNEDGIVTANLPDSAIIIISSTFTGNGDCATAVLPTESSRSYRAVT